MTATRDLKTLTDLIERQAAASADLTHASSFSEIVGALARHMLIEGGQFITISLLDHEDGKIRRLRVMASANRQQSFDSETVRDLHEDDQNSPLILALNDSAPVRLVDVEQDQAISNHMRAWLAEWKIKSFIAIPLRHKDRTFGVLGIHNVAEAIKLSDAELRLFQSLADQAATLIQINNLTNQSVHTSDLSEREARAFAELNSSLEYAQMAAVVARHMLPSPGRFIILSKYIYNAAGELTGWKVLATANRERTYNWEYESVDWTTITEDVQSKTLAGEPLIVSDTADIPPSDLGPGLYAMLASNGVRAFLNIPMFIDGKPVAALAVASRSPQNFAKAEIAAFRNLADQIAALIYTRTLLDEAQSARDVANNLVLASRMITSADNYDDMAQAVIYTVARSMSAVSISLFDQPGERTIVAIGTPDGALTFTPGRFRDRAPSSEQLETLRQGLPVIVGDIYESGSPFSDETQAQYARLNATWCASFGLQTGDTLLGTLDILNAGAVTFSIEETDAYNTLADQIAITLENRNLLSQKEETLNFVQAQFEATSKIYNAKTATEMLDAIYHFAGTGYNHAHLALVEPDTLPPLVRVVSEMNYNQLIATDRQVTLDGYPAAEALSALETLYVPEVATEEFLTAEERERLKGQDIQALMIVPLVSNQRLLGLVAFMHTSPRTIPAGRLRAVRSLADQMAVVFENQSLLRSTAQTLEETQLLYETNRSILAAQDTMDILRTLRTNLAPDAAAINHLVVTYDESQQQIKHLRADVVNTPTEEQLVDFAVDELIGEDRLAALTKLWGESESTISVVEDAEALPADHPMADYYRTIGVKSSISIPIRERGLVREAVILTFNYSQTFDSRQRRLYEALSDQIGVVLQSHRLLRDAQVSASQLGGQVRVLQIVNQLAMTLSNTQDEDELLEHSARALVEATGVDHCGIVIVNPQETLGRVASEYPALGALNLQIDMTSNELYQIIRTTRQPITVDDVQADTRVTQATKESMKSLGIHGLGFFPIFVHDRIFGSIGLDLYSAGRKFTPEMVNVAQTITAQIAIGLQNLRLLSDAQRRAEQLQRITTFSQSVQATLDMATIFNIMISESTQMLQEDQMSIALNDPASGELRLVAQHVEEYTSVNLNTTEVMPLTGPMARVWETWELLHIPDARASNEKLPAKMTARSWMIAPLISRGRILGLVSVGCMRPHVYGDTDLAVFQQMVNQLAVAIENAEAFTQSQRVAKNESLVNEISTQLQRQLDIHSMMDVTVNELGKVLGARKARIRLGTTAPRVDEQ